MSVAARTSQPHSVLLGRERVSRTTFVYDDDGRLVEAVTVHDPEWLPVDVEKAIGWDTWQHHPYHCPSGHLLPPWLDEAGKELIDQPFAIAHGRCPACELLADDAKGRDENDAGMYPLFKDAEDVAFDEAQRLEQDAPHEQVAFDEAQRLEQDAPHEQVGDVDPVVE